MININTLPCLNCKSYIAIIQPNNTESGEYVGCKKAKEKNAKFLLVFKDKKFSCPEFVDIGDD